MRRNTLFVRRKARNRGGGLGRARCGTHHSLFLPPTQSPPPQLGPLDLFLCKWEWDHDLETLIPISPILQSEHLVKSVKFNGVTALREQARRRGGAAGLLAVAEEAAAGSRAVWRQLPQGGLEEGAGLTAAGSPQAAGWVRRGGARQRQAAGRPSKQQKKEKDSTEEINTKWIEREKERHWLHKRGTYS